MQFRLNKRAGKLGQRLISNVHAPIHRELQLKPFNCFQGEIWVKISHVQGINLSLSSIKASKLTYQPRDFDS